jgi:hypothetical protein
VTVACLHQPNFLPWVKLIDKIVASDIWLVYDSAQYTKTEFHSRQRIKGPQGAVWLSVPVITAGRPRFQTLRDVRLCTDHDWRRANQRLLREHYARAPYWADVQDLLDPAYHAPHRYLVDFNLHIITSLLAYLGCSTTLVRTSAFSDDGDRTDRLIRFNQAVSAQEHLTSTWASDEVALDWGRVAAAGITVREQHFHEPVHPQAYGPFRPNLSIIDLIAHCGRESAGLLTEGRLTRVVLPGCLAAAGSDAGPVGRHPAVGNHRA